MNCNSRKCILSGIVLLISMVLVPGCKKKSEDQKKDFDRSFMNLPDPGPVKDSLGRGRFVPNYKMNRIYSIYYNHWVEDQFHYYPGTDKLRTVLNSVESLPASCTKTWTNLFYSFDRIDSIENYNHSSGCDVIVKIYRYNYYPSGTLKSVILQNAGDWKEEHYFSYDNSGRIDKIYLYTTSAGVEDYGPRVFSYERNESGNVSKLTIKPNYSDEPEQISTFAYDESVNPFRNLFIPYMTTHIYTCCEEIGPNFLSYNTVKETTRTYPSASNTYSLPYQRNVFGVKLMSCSYFDQYKREYFYD